MVASLDIHVFFETPELLARLHERFASRPAPGGGRVLTSCLRELLPEGARLARLDVGDSPLGLIAETESGALEALAEGVDEAEAFSDPDDAAITRFLDRVRARATIRSSIEERRIDFAHAERLTALGSLVAGVAHEINNPLSTVMLGLDVMRDNCLSVVMTVCSLRDALAEGRHFSDEELRDALKGLPTKQHEIDRLLGDISTATETIAELVRDLRIFSRSEGEESSTRFSPLTVIEQALRLVRREFPLGTIVEYDLPKAIPEVYLPKNRLAQVLTNLLVNAAHAIQGVQRNTHRVRVGARVDDQYVALSISDTGPGIPEDSLEKIFDPFFTTKRPGQGTGLGLSISRSIVQQMGGDLVVSSGDGSSPDRLGATFVCFIPLPGDAEEQSSQRRRTTPLAEQRSARTRTLLLVDEDENVLRIAARALEQDYFVLTARDGSEARDLLESGSDVDAIITELALPELDGPDFYAWLASKRSDVSRRVLFLTAAQENARYADFLEAGVAPVVFKPVSREDLMTAVARLFTNEGNTSRSERS